MFIFDKLSSFSTWKLSTASDPTTETPTPGNSWKTNYLSFTLMLFLLDHLEPTTEIQTTGSILIIHFNFCLIYNSAFDISESTTEIPSTGSIWTANFLFLSILWYFMVFCVHCPEPTTEISTTGSITINHHIYHLI